MVRKKEIYNVWKMSKKQPQEISSKPATFEEAISATKFGKFNIFLLLFGGLPIAWSLMFSMGNISQIIPSLKCDFNLSLNQVGIVNASPFVGHIVGNFLWGYIADRYGRRKLMICTAFGNSVFEFITAFSINADMLIVFKCIGGFLITAPAGLIMSYLAECHRVKYRGRMIMAYGICMGAANFILPLLAWAILPRNFNYFQPWRLYLLATSIPSLIGGISFIFIPETPKFCMSSGNYDEALKIFKNIYSINTGKPENSFPITTLRCDTKTEQIHAEKQTINQIIKDRWQQFKPLFHKPYLYRLFLSLWLQGFLMMGANTLKIWIPELLTLMDDYKKNNNGTSTKLCNIIQLSLQNKTNENEFSNTDKKCSDIQTSDEVYIVLIIIGAMSVFFYVLLTATSSVLNSKVVLGCSLIISGFSGIALIWIKNPIAIFVISAGYTTQAGVALVTLLSIVVDLFPTSFRTTTVLLCSLAGRSTSVIGNLITPVLFQSGCAPAFVFLGGGILICLIPLILLSKVEPEDT